MGNEKLQQAIRKISQKKKELERLGLGKELDTAMTALVGLDDELRNVDELLATMETARGVEPPRSIFYHAADRRAVRIRMLANGSPRTRSVGPEVLEKVNSLVEVLIQERRKGCAWLMVENIAPDLLDKLLEVVSKYAE